MSKKNKLDILYEDKYFLVVNKPAGLLTVSTDKEKEKTLFHEVLMYEKKKNKNNKVFIVHRLDKDTSGIILFVKDQKLKFTMQNNWDSLVKLRSYVAITDGFVKKDSDTIKSYLAEDKTLRTYITDSKKGKLAITKYRVVSKNNKYSLLEVEIKTGRKNQIRVQLSSIGNPIIGDKKYGALTNPINRLGLHANKLVIINPINNKELVFETDVPKEFINLFMKKSL